MEPVRQTSRAGEGALCTELRETRLRAGLSAELAADELGWPTSKLAKIEAGTVEISAADLRSALRRYGIRDEPLVRRYIQRAKDSRRQAWSEYRDVLNPEFLIYLGYEGSARRLRKYDLMFVPGPLQTEQYARAVIWGLAKPQTSERVLERQLEVRTKRRERFDADEEYVAHFILDQSALHRPAATDSGRETLVEQLRHLTQVALRPNVTIQVVPFGSGLQPGLLGSFNLLDFADPGDDEVLFVENVAKSLLTRDHVEEIERYRELFDQLGKLALDPEQTFELFTTQREGAIRP